MFKIFENSFSNRQIKVNLNEFEEGIEFAYENKCDGFNLASAVGSKEVVIDLNLFKKLAGTLTYLSIDGYVNLKDHKNVDGIYTLKKLEKIVIGKQKIKFDFLNFPELRQIGLDYSKLAVNFDKLKFLEVLIISYYDKKNLEELSPIPSLKTLHIYQSKIIDLKGLDKMSNLEELNLNRNKNLVDISEITELNKLLKLHIEKCPGLQNFSILKGNKSIQNLLISKLDSVSFVRGMSNLEIITFWELENGDLTPLLKVPALKKISFHPNRKHYSHTKEEINALLMDTKR